MDSAVQMRAARLHDTSQPLVVERIPRPVPGDGDVLVGVQACGIVPNLGRVLHQFKHDFPFLPLPPFPAVFGLDPAGIVEAVGSNVKGVRPGDRVYVNPMRSCDSCHRCFNGDRALCAYATFSGYFGFSPNSVEMHQRYPTGGLAEYIAAPAYAAVKLPDNVSFDEAARFGYIGTAFAGLRRAAMKAGDTVLIGGASGTLGVSAVVSALALGAKRILAVARNHDLLARVKAIAPARIETWSVLDGPIADWVRTQTDGDGADIGMDCLPTGAPLEMFLECLDQVGPGGTMVNVGGVVSDVPIAIYKLMHRGVRLIGSNWFEACHGSEMASLAEAGLLDLSVFDHHKYGLDEVDLALSRIDPLHGGLANYVICP